MLCQCALSCAAVIEAAAASDVGSPTLARLGGWDCASGVSCTVGVSDEGRFVLAGGMGATYSRQPICRETPMSMIVLLSPSATATLVAASSKCLLCADVTIVPLMTSPPCGR